MIQRLLILLKDPDYRVRFILARRIGILFLTWDGHDVLFHDIWWVDFLHMIWLLLFFVCGFLWSQSAWSPQAWSTSVANMLGYGNISQQYRGKVYVEWSNYINTLVFRQNCVMDIMRYPLLPCQLHMSVKKALLSALALYPT